MTDERIIKALKHCYEHKSCNDCVGCLGAEECILNVDPAGYIYPIINRQQSEIERLNSCVKSEDEVRAIANATIQAGIKIIKATAIKECLDRIEAFLCGVCGSVVEDNPNLDRILFGYNTEEVDAFIDNLRKEMVGEGK